MIDIIEQAEYNIISEFEDQIYAEKGQSKIWVFTDGSGINWNKKGWQALQHTEIHNDLALVLKMINFFWSEK